MVAVHAAHPATDATATVASELGWLLHARRMIRDPRWRLEATARVIPALDRYGVSMHDYAGVRAELHDAANAAVCPPRLRTLVTSWLVRAAIAGRPGVDALIGALWSRSWAGAGFRAIAGSLALQPHGNAYQIVEGMPRRTLVRAMRRAIATGIVTTPGSGERRFVADVDARGAEGLFPPSLPRAIAVIDAICRTGDGDRIDDAGATAVGDSEPDRAIVRAHLARIDLRFDSLAAALARVRGVAARGIRAGAGLLLVRACLAAGRIDDAERAAAAIEASRFRQRAWLDIARALDVARAPRRALSVLDRVDDPGLAADRVLTRTEILLAAYASRTRTQAPTEALAARAPGWTFTGDPQPLFADRLHVTRAIEHLMVGLDGPRHAPSIHAAAGELDKAGPHRPVLRMTLALIDRIGLDADDVLRVLGDAGAAIAEPLRAERVALRAEAMARGSVPLPEPLRRGLAGDPPPSLDARSLDRALYDEGVSLSAAAPRRRRILIQAARHCLVAPACPAPVIESRLRSLVHLGGQLARDAITAALARSPAWFSDAIAALCTIDAKLAARLAIDHAAERELDVEAPLRLAEAHRGVGHGFAHAWIAARKRLDMLGVARPDAWLRDLVRAAADVPPAMLCWIARRNELPADPRELLAELDRRVDAASRELPDRLAARIAGDDDLLDVLLLARPARVAPRIAAWTAREWRQHAGRASSEIDSGAIDPDVVGRCVRALQRPDAVDAVIAHGVGVLGVVRQIDLAIDGVAHRIRLLDKTGDLLTYLRFADVPAWSCYRSDSPWFRGDLDTRGAVLAVWKDPLSFCFHIERADASGVLRPFGFVFGGFAALETDETAGPRVAVVLNGVYAAAQRDEIRAAVIRAIDGAVRIPLGLRHTAIASKHGGRGFVPPDFERRKATITRFRALAYNGKPVSRAYDDISFEVNTRIEVDHLAWRDGASCC
jgi:hypothetical protein